MQRRDLFISIGAFMTGIAGLRILQRDDSGVLMPALFVGHGSPMNILEENKFTRNLVQLGKTLPRPAAIVCASAHWMTPQPEVTLADKPRQIFDFQGFPPSLYQVLYTPDGSSDLAKVMTGKNPRISATEEWGLDHGTWSVLHHMYPKQDIPVLQLSLGLQMTVSDHLKLAQELRYLRRQGVLLMGSGNIVHNLRMIAREPDAEPHDWALEFEDLVLKTMGSSELSQEEKIARIFASSGLKTAHPTIEHLLPLVYALGFSEEGELPQIDVRGIQNASVSMAAMRFLTK